MGSALRFLAYAVLAPFAPLVRLVMIFFAFLGFVACAIYRLLLHDPQFPLESMLVMSLGLCVGSAVFGALVRRLGAA